MCIYHQTFNRKEVGCSTSSGGWISSQCHSRLLAVLQIYVQNSSSYLSLKGILSIPIVNLSYPGEQVEHFSAIDYPTNSALSLPSLQLTLSLAPVGQDARAVNRTARGATRSVPSRCLAVEGRTLKSRGCPQSGPLQKFAISRGEHSRR